MIRRGFLWVLLAATVGLWAFSDRLFPPEQLSAPTANIRDGDTLIMGGRALRLDGIDAPEYRQTCNDAKGADWPCGKAARTQLESLAGSGSLVCELRETDRYGRALARCSTASIPDLGEAMVLAGLALGPEHYAPSQASAQRAKRGIWQGKFAEPAQWRAEHPREDPQ